MSTLVALIASVILYFFHIQADPASITTFAISVGALLVFSILYLYGAFFTSLQKEEQNTTPRLVELFKKDQGMFSIRTLILALPVLLFIAAVFHNLFAVIILTGIGFDLLLFYSRKLLDYLNPFRVVGFLRNEANYAIDNDQDQKFCELIEGIAQIANKALDRHNGALANHVVNALEKLGERFLGAVKSISHPTQNSQLKAEGVADTISYVLILILQHLEAIFHRAIDKNLELVAGHIVTTLSRLAAYASAIDLSLAPLPVHYIKKLTLGAMKKGFTDVGVKATIGLNELAKAISKLDLSYQDLKIPMISLITTQETIQKEIFRQDKDIKIAILIAPFAELGKVLEQEPLKGHPDTPFLIQQINRIITEFQTLETVLRTMPPMPKLVPEEGPVLSKEVPPPSPDAAV